MTPEDMQALVSRRSQLQDTVVRLHAQEVNDPPNVLTKTKIAEAVKELNTIESKISLEYTSSTAVTGNIA